MVSLLKRGVCEVPRFSEADIETLPPLEESPVEELTEASPADLASRLSMGVFTQRDVEFILGRGSPG
ncbi:MAG TPA: hypothetical protein VF914_04655 [Chloroflexia bacterium]